MFFIQYLERFFTFSPILFKWVLLFLFIDIIRCSIFSFLKWQWLKKVGVSLVDRKSIFSSRRVAFNLNYLLTTYSERTLQIVDGLTRKGQHVVSGIFQLVILTYVITDPMLSLQVLFIRSVIMSFLLWKFKDSDHLFGLGNILYGAYARVRDGKSARTNFLIAFTTGGTLVAIFMPLFLFFLEQQAICNKIILQIGSFIYLPLIIGDAAGEVIGSLWGKQVIRVYGIGEINRKSWLGVAAVFLFSLMSLIWVVYFNHLPMAWFVLSFVLSLSTTIVELFSVRSTDNFNIVASNALICYIFILFNSSNCN